MVSGNQLDPSHFTRYRSRMPALSQELVSLVHHVQLNETGWWDKAMERLVLATIWEGRGQVTAAALTAEVERLHQVRLDVAQVNRQLNRLKSTRAVVVTSNGTLKVTEERLAELEAGRAAGEAQLDRVKARFAREIEACGLMPTAEIWEAFSARWLQPTVCSLGARTYDMIRGGFDADWLSSTDLTGFLSSFPPELHAMVRQGVTRFLDPDDADVRQYLLR